MAPKSLQKTITHIRSRTDQLANFVYSPDAREILAQGDLHPARAMVIRAILATPRLPKFLHEHTQGSAYRRAGFDILGIGYHAITVDDGPSTVRKFYRHTAAMSEGAQKKQIDIWCEKQSYALEHLAEYAVAQSFAIEANPLNPSQSIVTATQERIHSTSGVNMFVPETIPESAQAFLRDSRAMLIESGIAAAPDLPGRDYAVIDTSTGAIKLIDPITLVASDPTDEVGYQKVARFLERYQ